MQQLSAIDQLFSAKLAEIAIFRRAGQKLSELTALISLLKERELRSVVEIGADKGGTFWLWCQMAETDALIVSIDLPGADYGDGYTEEDAKRFSAWAKPDQALHFC